jgi:hypothetical protein
MADAFVIRETPAGRVSRGLPWAFVMLALELAECLVLIEVVFSDRPRSGLATGFGLVELYFLLVIATFLCQIAGIVLVTKGRPRLGGILQLVSSAPHVLKVEGLIGIVGGVKALDFARRERAAG